MFNLIKQTEANVLNFSFRVPFAIIKKTSHLAEKAHAIIQLEYCINSIKQKSHFTIFIAIIIIIITIITIIRKKGTYPPPRNSNIDTVQLVKIVLYI